MSKNGISIDESTHERVLPPAERLRYALTSMLLAFLLVNIIAFWMFPGPGIFGIYLFSNAHSMVAFIGDWTNITVIAFVAICGVMGWFKGKYFTDRMKGYIGWWQFW